LVGAGWEFDVRPSANTGAAMSIEVTWLPDAEPARRHVAIGTFDGVHVGHRAVIEGADAVLTFEPHPLRILHPEAVPKLIMPFDIKRDVIEGLDVKELIVIPFDEEFTRIEAEEFVGGVLVERLGATVVSVGENFRFGARARGDPAMLAAYDEFETRIVPLVEVDGETVSSSRIRALIAAGEVVAAARCLGAPFLLEGEVVEGDRRGRTLGFPTANVVPDDSLVVPGHGVYAGFANGIPAAINVGIRPTFQTGRGLLVEAYLIDYDGDLYGRKLRVAFIERLRGERRFPSAQDLIAQMQRDVEEARELCASFTAVDIGAEHRGQSPRLRGD
jgi:riboflavin kinase/FMN adenylyltransferase